MEGEIGCTCLDWRTAGLAPNPSLSLSTVPPPLMAPPPPPPPPPGNVNSFIQFALLTVFVIQIPQLHRLPLSWDNIPSSRTTPLQVNTNLEAVQRRQAQACKLGARFRSHSPCHPTSAPVLFRLHIWTPHHCSPGKGRG